MKCICSILMVLILFLSPLRSSAEEIGLTIEALPWEQANKLIPKYTKFTVLDTETGLSFKVQRRAGSNHADVQPLTKADTAIMKKIYSGKWSWKRRAIIVQYKDNWIAASMHGMPHGAGSLPNDFPGHFCIHFYGSTTHKTNEMDLSHKLMVLKAAGKLENHLAKADPYELVNAYVAGFKQQDQSILNLASLQKMKWGPILSKVVNVRISRIFMLPAEDITDELYISVPIEIDWLIENEGGKAFRGEVHLIRFSSIGSWKIDSIHFIDGNKYLK
ncbi:hypothetical protein NEOCIP111885_03626 [Pseudoneobacillus rhizosphaerae]|uniref:Uncharacterized protein n=2 Tax=Pseudoneobacillus rhizosphaerae TaxID=2880968 RepID=A0A9C7GCP0_9BACI|nr:hypothetical protein NEOCIP111885_03626 [Pseudoneobacillus rhizosphaerae]